LRTKQWCLKRVELRAIQTEESTPYYEVWWFFIDSATHSGLPQSRRRVYVVGLERAAMAKPFVPPGPITMAPLSEILSTAQGSIDEFKKMSATKQKNVMTLMSRYELLFERHDLSRKGFRHNCFTRATSDVSSCFR